MIELGLSLILNSGVETYDLVLEIPMRNNVDA